MPTNSGSSFDWRPFLQQVSCEMLMAEDIRSSLPPDVVASGWLGYDGATEEDITSLEARLGEKLPPSYRTFLAESNGWRNCGYFIYNLWPCTDVRWFSERNQEWIDAYVHPENSGITIRYPPGQEPPPPKPLTDEEYLVYGEEQIADRFRTEYLQTALEISDVGDSAVLLLNPKTISDDGEWEAWLFANWMPGASRYRSFWDLIQAEFRSFVDLRNQDESRYFAEDGIETLRPKLPGLIHELAEKAQGHREGQQARASRGCSGSEAYTDGIIEALNDAEAAVKRIESQGLAPDALLGHLMELAADLEHQWKANFRPNSCGVDNRDGRAEGNREATGIIRWFLNQT